MPTRLPYELQNFPPTPTHLMFIYVRIFTFHKCRFSLFSHSQCKLFFHFFSFFCSFWICFHFREFIHILCLSSLTLTRYRIYIRRRSPRGKNNKTDKTAHDIGRRGKNEIEWEKIFTLSSWVSVFNCLSLSFANKDEKYLWQIQQQEIRNE